ncbi:MAG TPA: sigma-70 family RNA polymerase sigma factor [Caldilineaceae bacterium]|nr:sigma-70 family RNA polymerase sigma factor [Caldilineaceae bacterium]
MTAPTASSTTVPLAPDEQAAIEQALAGDLNAFNRLVVKYQRLAYSVAYRLMQSEDAASDAVQDSFIKAFRALHTFKGGQFKSWLMRIVVNTCYDMLRVQQRYVTESIGDEPDEEGAATYLVDQSESPHEYAERMELNQLIELGIRSLPPDQRLVLTLCDVHGYSYEEIVEITGYPMGTVKSRISRARTKLRDFLLQQPELLPSTLRPKHR